MSLPETSTLAGLWLIDWSIKGSVLFAAALTAGRLCRRTQPELMLAVHRAVLAALFAGPLVMLAAKFLAVATKTGSPLPDLAAVIPMKALSFAALSQSSTARAGDGPMLVAAVWMLGALLSLSSYARSLAALRRAFDVSAPLPGRLQPLVARLQARCGTAATVVGTRAVKTPCTFGLTRQVVLVPTDLLRAPAWQIEAVLTHELLHVRGRDTLWLLLGELICALNWFNPLAWTCVRQHRQLMEVKCDARSIAAGVPMQEYVRAIASTSRHLLVHRGAAAAMAADGVIARLRRLIEGHETKPLMSGWRLAIAGVGGLFALLLGTTSLTGPSARAAPAPLQGMIDRGTQRLGPVKAGSARLYVVVSPGITLRAPTAGFMCEGINCVTTVPARPAIQLTAEAKDGSPLHWVGCDRSVESDSCTLRFDEGDHLVQVMPAAE
jgi:beta-lactamase regulating signal transducer with metallopeptidase domain